MEIYDKYVICLSPNLDDFQMFLLCSSWFCLGFPPTPTPQWPNSKKQNKTKKQCLSHVCSSQGIPTCWQTALVFKKSYCMSLATLKNIHALVDWIWKKKKEAEKTHQVAAQVPLPFAAVSFPIPFCWGEGMLYRTHQTVRKRLSATLTFKREGFLSLSFTYQRRHSGRK